MRPLGPPRVGWGRGGRATPAGPEEATPQAQDGTEWEEGREEVALGCQAPMVEADR